MDFFDTRCQSGPYTQEAFGVRDDRPGQMAYVDTNPENAAQKWIAEVRNVTQTAVTFTAVDGCVIESSAERGRGRCDAMLTTARSLFLLELKDRKGRGDWRTHGFDQLESTIRFLIEHHANQLKQFTKKKAHVCNRRVSNFVEIEQEHKRRFKKYGFRIDTQAKVVIDS